MMVSIYTCFRAQSASARTSPVKKRNFSRETERGRGEKVRQTAQPLSDRKQTTTQVSQRDRQRRSPKEATLRGRRVTGQLSDEGTYRTGKEGFKESGRAP